MSKTSKTKKSKVPKITELEYARYIASLKSEPDGSPEAQANAIPLRETAMGETKEQTKI